LNNFYVFIFTPDVSTLAGTLFPHLLQQQHVCLCSLLSTERHIAGKEKVKTTDVLLGENHMKIANVAVQCRGLSPSQLPHYLLMRKAFGL
jgi:hypothetical protein